jgi:hypothetical protein
MAAILVVTAASSSRQKGQSVQGSPSTATAACPDTVPWTGKYRNHSFGFIIEIPKPLKGFWNSAVCVAGPDGCTCMGDHGRIVPLSNPPYEPERHIEIYAGHASDLDKPTVGAEVASRLRQIHERNPNHRVYVLKRSHIMLSGLRGERVLVRYFDEKLKRWWKEDFIELVRKGSIEYSLYLRTGEHLYQHDKIIFEKIISSFVLTSGEYTKMNSTGLR